MPMRSMKPANCALGAVPILVPMPPMFDAVGDGEHDRHAVVREPPAAAAPRAARSAPCRSASSSSRSRCWRSTARRRRWRPASRAAGAAARRRCARMIASAMPAVQVPLLHRRGDRHAAGEEEDVGVDVGQPARRARSRRGRRRTGRSSGNSDQRQAGGPVDRQRLGEPPDRHQRRHRRRPRRPRAPFAVVLERRVEQQQQRGRQQPGEHARNAAEAQR